MSSNANAAIALAMTVALLTGIAKAHPERARRHTWALPRSSPERIEVENANISVPVRPVSGRAVRGMDAPSRTRERTAGWYRDGPSPGEVGPAVIIGYLDSAAGPAPFHRLARVERGDRVKVIRRDGRVVWFTVDSVRHVSKPPAPHGRTLGDAARPELRLITCRDRSAQSRHGDAGNLMVSAHVVPPGPSDPSGPSGR
ncbi:MAG: peptidase sortase [Actinoallomurus sp.]|nr:peptidase sortase [Actinoallomurus sp.]